MQNPGRGRRHAAVSFALAIVALCSFGATGAQADDELTIVSPDTTFRVDGLVNETGGRSLRLGIRYGAAGPHLTPGTQVRLRPAPTAEFPSAADVVISVPSDWGPGHPEAFGVGDVSYKLPAQLGEQPRTLTYVPVGPQCASPGCLPAAIDVDWDLRVKPRPATNFTVTPMPANTFGFSWTASPDWQQLFFNRITWRRQGGTETGSFTLAGASTSGSRFGFFSGSTYCFTHESVFLQNGNTFDEYKTTGLPNEVCQRQRYSPEMFQRPTATPLENTGQFALTWPEASDGDPGETFTYNLQKRRASEPFGWTTVATGINGRSYSVDEPNEGSYAYRVQAVDSLGWTSSFSPESFLVKVDKSRPSAPQATTDPAAPTASGWFKDSVHVTWGGSTDPNLADGSTGSGIASYSAAQTLAADGEHTIGGTATDRAGNVSDPGSATVKVDAAAPVVQISCPAGIVTKGDTAYADWTASDSGSGLAGDSAGRIELDTATAGIFTVTAPAAQDAVGHESNAPSCIYEVNTPPDAPGAPAGPDGGIDQDGEFTLTWSGATDPDGDAVTYDVRRNGAEVATGLTAAEYAADVEDGTYTYAVRSVDDNGAASAWVDGTPVKVDGAKPSAPEATTDPAAPAPGADGWFKDSVTVSFGGSSDPDLADGSEGTGIAGYTAPITVDEEGTRTVSGTATDRAGNESDATSKTVKVDTSTPVVAYVCPADAVLLNSDQSVGWTATDSGSGLATPASGTVALDTGTAGAHQVDIPVARDVAGHESDAKTCSYEVNSPPETPGVPSGPGYDRDGSFELSWDGAADPDAGDTVGYVVEQRDSDDGDWSVANAGDASTEQSVSVGTGRWTFRVKAVDGRGGESDWSAPSAEVVVDDGAPGAPEAQYAPADEHEGWFKDAVTVSWAGSPDATLADGSDGSGVDPDTGYSDAESFDTAGEHTARGTATDRAGNRSEETAVTVNVDTTDPTADITCPADRVIRGTTATADWTASDTGSGLVGPGTGTVDLDTATAETKTASVTVRDVVGHEATSTCTYEVVPPNSPPAAPGAPNGPEVDGDGRLEVSWTKADDPDEGDAPAYLLEKQDADDGGAWSPLADGLDVPRADVELASGTWRFRVKAVDSHGASTDWVESSQTTKVDDGKPSAPDASTDPESPASGGWFKDSVKVSFAGSTDPALADGSAGSGVDSYRGGDTFGTDGTHTATGTAVDKAGNESGPTSTTVKVDATAPTTSISCPTAPLIVGQPGATATWTASDAHSGLASAASGSVALNTATAGVKTATAPAARDNVGHTGDAATCEYEVRYRFTGGVAPVEGSNVINVGRRGHTYPVRWRLSRWNGSLISDAEGTALARQMSATDTKVACSSFLSQDEDGLEEETGLPSPSLRYDTRKNWFVYSYQAPASGCFTLDIHRADGLNTKRWRFLFL